MGLFGGLKKSGQRLAISIAEDGMYAVSVRHAKVGKPTITLAMFQATEKGPQEESLQKFGKQLQTKKYRCSTLLGYGQYQLLSIDAPIVPQDEMKEAVRWRMKDMIDFSVAQATIDSVEVPASKSPGAHNQTLLAVAAQNSIIEQRQKLFSNASIALAVIDIPDMAQRNISVRLEPEGRGVAMLSFNSDGGLLTVTYAGELYMSRRIDVSLTQLLASDRTPKPGAEKPLVRDADLAADDVQLVPSEAQLTLFDKITLELQRSLDHCDRQFHFIVVAKLVLAPIAVPVLHAHLAANLYLPVEMLDLADIVDLSDAPHLSKLQQQQRFFLCLGAALRQEESAS